MKKEKFDVYLTEFFGGMDLVATILIIPPYIRVINCAINPLYRIDNPVHSVELTPTKSIIFGIDTEHTIDKR